MDPNYAMAKFRMESKDILRSNQKGCWYYLKYFFFFLSIIQFLIILGLVLFMLYGNAHLGTEIRLKSVENRYNNLTRDYNWLNGNHSKVNARLGLVEKEKQNCSEILAVKMKILSNRTVPLRPMPSIETCRIYQVNMERLNLTCTHERLSSLEYKLRKEREFDILKDNCTKTVNSLTILELQARSEKETFQNQKTDLQAQLKLLQDGCTSINVKFDVTLEQLKSSLDMAMRTADIHDPYQPMRCRPLTDSITNRIDAAINRLRQDVNIVMMENSQLKVNNDRLKEDLKQCNQEKDFTIRDKNRLTSEREALEKQQAAKNNELTKCYAQYMKKEEDLDNCRKPRLPGMLG